MTPKTNDLLAAYLKACEAGGATRMEIADNLRTGAAILGYGAAGNVDLAEGAESYIIGWTLDVNAQNETEAVEKAYAWMRAARRSDISFEVRRPGTTVQLENPVLDLSSILKPN